MSEWIQLMGGGKFSYDSPSFKNLSIEEFAVPLARIPRFSGQTLGWYSVLQHLTAAGLIAQEIFENASVAKACALHDVHEMVLGDIPSPLLRHLGELGVALHNLKAQIDDAVGERFKIDLRKYSEYIRAIDMALLSAEAQVLLKGGPTDLWHTKLDTDPWIVAKCIPKVHIVANSNPGPVIEMWRSVVEVAPTQPELVLQ